MSNIQKESQANQPSLQNVIEMYHLLQSAKTVPLFKSGKVPTINSIFLFFDGSGGVESTAVSCLDPA